MFLIYIDLLRIYICQYGFYLKQVSVIIGLILQETVNRQQKNTQPASLEDAIYEAEPGRVSPQHETEEPLYEPTPTDSQQPAPGGASENTAVALYDYQAGE